MKEKIDKIHAHLRKGILSAALDELYDLSRNHFPRHLEEVVGQITKLQLISSNDRAGMLAFEDRVRMEAQTSNAIIRMLNIFEASKQDASSRDVIQYLRDQLEVTKEEKNAAEKRLFELENTLEQQTDRSSSIYVRKDYPYDKVECHITAISHSVTQGSNYAVVLGQENSNVRLPIIIGTHEAQALAVALEGMEPNRPLTHDLIKLVVESLGYTVQEAIIDNLIDGIFYSKITLINNDSHIEIDCRTSDALSIAVRFNAPLYVSNHVLNAAGVTVDEEKGSSK